MKYFYTLLIIALSTFQLINAQIVVSGPGSIAIPDNGCASFNYAVSTATVNQASADAVISYIDLATKPSYIIDTVWLDISHIWIADIDVRMDSPNFTPIDLTSDNGGDADNYTNTRFTDGSPNISTGAAPFNGVFQAEEGPFATIYDGNDVNGDWTIYVCDDEGLISGTLNSFSISFSPSNDLCDNATSITMGTNHRGSNIGASMNNLPNELRSCSDDTSEGGAGVWYKYTGTGSEVIASTEHVYTDFDTEILVYTGDCNNLTCYAGNDRGGANGASKVAFMAANGVEYLIYVDGADNPTVTGVFQLSIESAESNNTFDGATNAYFVENSDNDCSSTISLDFSTGTTRSGITNTCDGASIGRDQFFYYNTRTDTLFWDSKGTGFPGITIWDVTGTIELSCFKTVTGGKLYGWESGDEIIIQIYDWISEFPSDASINFCLRDYILPVPNDECDFAMPLTVHPDAGCSGLTSATLYGATMSSVGLGGSNYAERDVWFSFVAMDTAQFVQLEGGSGVIFELFENNCNSHMSLGLSNEGQRSHRISDLTIGATYLIRVFSQYYNEPYDGRSFYICVGGLSPQDVCAGAIEIPFNTSCSPQLYSNSGATYQDIECVDPGIWMKVTVPQAGLIGIQTSGPGILIDTEISVYSGDCNNLVPIITCHDEDNTDDDDHELVYAYNSTPASDLYIKVSSYDIGSFSLCVFEADEVALGTSPSDNCSGATPLTVGTSCTAALYNFYNATNGPDECADKGVWFSAVIPASGNIVFQTSSPGINKDTRINAYSGSCGSLTLLSDDCQDDNNTSDEDHESITLTGLTPSDMIYFVVDDYGNSGTFSACAYDPGAISTPSDVCATATALTVGPICDPQFYTFAGAHNNPNECSDNGVWFSAVVPNSGNLLFETLSPGSNYDTRVKAYSGTCGLLTELSDGCQDDDNTPIDDHEQIQLLGLTPNDVIYFVVDDNDDGGTFSVCVSDPDFSAIPSDICQTAISLSVGTSCNPQLHSFEGASNGIYECSNIGVWFSAVVPTSGNLLFKTLFPGTNIDTEIKAYSGTCGSLTLLSEDCQDEDNTSDFYHEQITLNSLTPGTTIYFVVDDRGEGGTFSVCVYDPGMQGTPSDNCASATVLSVGLDCNPQFFTFEGATYGINECDYNGVWFSAIVPTSGNLLFKTLSPGSNVDTQIKAYSGSCASLTLLSEDCKDDDNTHDNSHEQILLTGLTPNSVIYYVVDDNDDGGTFSVCLSDPGMLEVSADICATAIPISVTNTCNSSALYSFSSATHGSNECSKGVWFSIIAPPTGKLYLSTLSLGYIGDPEISVFRGTCGNLELISKHCQDNDIAPDNLNEEIYLNNLIPGETIYLMVGANDETILFGVCATSGHQYSNCAEDDAQVNDALISFTTDSTFKTNQTLNSNIELGPYGQFYFRTEESINLDKNFSVPSGTQFIAEMGHCEDN